MSAPVAEPTTTNDDPLASIDLSFLTTPDSAPAAETPTRDDQPVSEPEEGGEQSDTDTPQAARDESGRFKAKEEGGEPKAEAADKPAEEEPQWRKDLEELRQRAEKAERQIPTLHDQVRNAAAQAAEKARQEERAAAEKRIRDDTQAELQRQIHSGELTYDQANAIWTRKQNEWAEADRQVQQQQHNQQRAGLMLTEAETGSQQKLLTLYQHGAQVLAEDTGLSVDEVRALWNEPEERERFVRASLQSEMATRLPGAGFNAQALNDYMATMVGTAKQIAALKKGHATELAALRKENEKLQQQLNREEADSDALRPETPARGGGPRRKEPTTLAEAGAELDRRLAIQPQRVRS